MTQLNKADIRDILMSNGFTIKKDQNDLKDYVFGAAEALLHAARQVPMPAPTLSDDVKACIERATANQEEDRPYKALEVALQYGFEYVDDDATILQVRDVDLTNLMSVLGFRRLPKKAPTGTMYGPVEVEIKVAITGEGMGTGVATICMGRGVYPTPAEIEARVKKMVDTEMPDGFRLLTKQEYWDHICIENAGTKFAMAGGPDFAVVGEHA